MTLAEMTTRVRQQARASTLSHSDIDIINLLNEGMREFTKDAHGLMEEARLTVKPRFDTETNYGIDLTGNSGTKTFAITATAREDATGGLVASDLQTAIQAATTAWSTATVSWSSTAWKFTITVPSASAVLLAAPDATDLTYVDAEFILGGATSQTGTTWTGAVPDDCAIEATLPSDYVSMNYAEWDRWELYETEFQDVISPEVNGEPTHYHVRGNKIRLYPSPQRQEYFHIWYKASVSELSGGATCPLPHPYHEAPVFYAAALICEENEELNKADRFQARYQRQVNNYTITYANNSPKRARVRDRFRQPNFKFRYEGT